MLFTGHCSGTPARGGGAAAGSYTLEPSNPAKQMESTLSGDRGNTMACRFTLNEPGVGPDGGGTVHCQLSTGGTIDGRFCSAARGGPRRPAHYPQRSLMP